MQKTIVKYVSGIRHDANNLSLQAIIIMPCIVIKRERGFRLLFSWWVVVGSSRKTGIINRWYIEPRIIVFHFL
jgi:hypothetical protein